MQAPSNPPISFGGGDGGGVGERGGLAIRPPQPRGEMALQTGSQQSRSYRGNVTQINTLQRFSVKGKVHPKTVKSHIILKNN